MPPQTLVALPRDGSKVKGCRGHLGKGGRGTLNCEKFPLLPIADVLKHFTLNISSCPANNEVRHAESSCSFFNYNCGSFCFCKTLIIKTKCEKADKSGKQIVHFLRIY